jgi:hypothetical protein
MLLALRLVTVTKMALNWEVEEMVKAKYSIRPGDRKMPGARDRCWPTSDYKNLASVGVYVRPTKAVRIIVNEVGKVSQFSSAKPHQPPTIGQLLANGTIFWWITPNTHLSKGVRAFWNAYNPYRDYRHRWFQEMLRCKGHYTWSSFGASGGRVIKVTRGSDGHLQQEVVYEIRL